MIRERKGFTLIELLVVIAIIAILAAILFPIFAAARSKARASSCLANMNQIAKAIMSYTGEFDDKFPCTRGPAGKWSPEQGIMYRNAAGTYSYLRGTTWVERIDPYVAKGSVVDPDGPGGQLPGATGQMVGVFNCPEREKRWPSGAPVDYHSYGYNFLYLGLPWPTGQTNAGVNPYAPTFIAGATRVSRLENTAETVMLCEGRSIWAFPPYLNTLITDNAPNQTAIPENKLFVSPRHSDKVNVAFCDGHSRAMNGPELVGRQNGGQGLPLKNRQKGIASTNRLWDVVKTKPGMNIIP